MRVRRRYVRLNRQRLKSSGSEAVTALSCLYEVLLNLTRVMSPFTPFFAEYLYRHLRAVHPNALADPELVPVDAVGRAESVHFVMVPEPDVSRVNARMEVRARTRPRPLPPSCFRRAALPAMRTCARRPPPCA